MANERECASASTCGKSSCEGCPSAKKGPKSFQIEQNGNSDIKHVIGVVSGKGGVGKSLVTASLANALAKLGCRVGILDADITGPSIPKMYGLNKPADALDEKSILPELTDNDIKVMSLNLLMPDPEQAVVWRGPIIAGVVKQFWTDVVWGDIDYLLVDMPPGTGDVPLTVYQSLPLDGVVIVTSPQDLVRMIVAKAVNMAELMKVPVLGIVENYSYLKCPDCGKIINVFGRSRIDEIAAEKGLQVLGKIPIDPSLAEKADEGSFAEVDNTFVADAVRAIVNIKKEQ